MCTKKIINDNYFKIANDILLFSIIITLLDTLSFFSIFYFCDLYFYFFIFLLIFLLFFFGPWCAVAKVCTAIKNIQILLREMYTGILLYVCV